MRAIMRSLGVFIEPYDNAIKHRVVAHNSGSETRNAQQPPHKLQKKMQIDSSCVAAYAPALLHEVPIHHTLDYSIRENSTHMLMWSGCARVAKWWNFTLVPNHCTAGESKVH